MFERRHSRARWSRRLAGCAILTAVSAVAAADSWIKDPITDCAVWSDKPAGARVVSWSGACVDGKASGEGALVVMSDGAVDVRYEGAMAGGKATGLGLVSYRTASGFAHYAGQLEESTLHGRGFNLLPDGSRYTGEFANDVPHGAGSYTAPDGSRYQGEFEKGEPHGNGYDVRPDGETYYGQYADGQRQGRGWIRYPNGDDLFGEFRDGVPHGTMRLVRADGTEEQQVWNNGKQVR